MRMEVRWVRTLEPDYMVEKMAVLFVESSGKRYVLTGLVDVINVVGDKTEIRVWNKVHEKHERLTVEIGQTLRMELEQARDYWRYLEQQLGFEQHEAKQVN